LPPDAVAVPHDALNNEAALCSVLNHATRYRDSAKSRDPTIWTPLGIREITRRPYDIQAGASRGPDGRQ
jgi:hypothetical protein